MLRKIFFSILFSFCFSSFVHAAIDVITPKTVSVPNPLGHPTSIEKMVGNVITLVLPFLGSVALLMFVYGGFLWMVAGGSPERVAKGKQVFMWASIGLAIIFTAGMMVRLVFQGLNL